MAKVRNSANTVRSGRIGENTWYVRDGEQIVRQRLNNSNYGEGASRTEKQQERRAKWGNLVNFFKVISQIEKKAYESKAKGVTDYNMFMSANINSTPIYLTKAQVEAGGSVPGAFVMSKGSLPTISTEPYGENNQPRVVTDIDVTGEVLAESTIASLSSAIVANNTDWSFGDALCMMWFGVEVDGEGIPRASVAYKEFVLDATDTTSIGDDFDFFHFDGGVLGYETFAGQDMFGTIAIHSRSDGGLKVSNQSIVLTNPAAISSYTSDSARTAAINSYGVEGQVILEPGD